jgi:uncharacterized protein
METLPMFPLGLVAFPGSVIPLRLFEDRYLALYHALVDGDGEFGIVLIERGVAEAGGGQHFSTGSVVRLMGSTDLEDGSVMIVTVGTDRLRVDRWLDDDPYPRAIVERLPMPTEGESAATLVADCLGLLATLLAHASELGSDVGLSMPTLSDDPAVAMYELAHMVPIQELDQQRILEADDVDSGAEILKDAMRGAVAVLEMQLGES